MGIDGSILAMMRRYSAICAESPGLFTRSPVTTTKAGRRRLTAVTANSKFAASGEIPVVGEHPELRIAQLDKEKRLFRAQRAEGEGEAGKSRGVFSREDGGNGGAARCDSQPREKTGAII